MCGVCVYFFCVSVYFHVFGWLPCRHSARRSIVRGSSFPPRYYSFDYFFYDWYEPTGVKGLRFHDTDVLISTTSSQEKAGSFPDTLVVAFAGTASVADAVTNVQTFEPANHSKFFEYRMHK